MKRIKKDNKIIKFQSHGVTGTVEWINVNKVDRKKRKIIHL